MIEFRHILCPIDFSDISIRALTYAAAFAQWYEAQLDVLHVAPTFAEEFIPREPGAMPHPWEIGVASREEITAAMHRAVAAADAARVNPRVLTQEGRAHEMIVRRAQAQPADLLVMGTHGRSGFNRLLLGSVTERVLRAAPCPVLTVPAGAPVLTGAPVTLKRILCPIDYSSSALRALQYALDLGRQVNGCVTVLYALEYMDPQEPCEHVAFDIRQARQHFIDHARERLHARVAQEPTEWCEIEEVVAVDRAYKAILRQAADARADLIVMGAQGTGGLELMLYGSNTQHVVRAAVCPVLTVRA